MLRGETCKGFSSSSYNTGVKEDYRSFQFGTMEGIQLVDTVGTKWTLLVDSCTKCKYSIFSQSLDERACICNVSRSNCMRLFAAFSTYHSLRKLHSDIVSNATFSGDFELVLEAALELITHFAPEADMIGQDVILSCCHGALNSRLNQWSYNVCIILVGENK